MRPRERLDRGSEIFPPALQAGYEDERNAPTLVDDPHVLSLRDSAVGVFQDPVRVRFDDRLVLRRLLDSGEDVRYLREDRFLQIRCIGDRCVEGGHPPDRCIEMRK